MGVATGSAEALALASSQLHPVAACMSTARRPTTRTALSHRRSARRCSQLASVGCITPLQHRLVGGRLEHLLRHAHDLVISPSVPPVDLVQLDAPPPSGLYDRPGPEVTGDCAPHP